VHRAAVLASPRPAAEGPLELRHRELPEAGPDDVVLAVRACAVCRTDLQLCEGDLPAHRLPVVPGHQVVGRVIGAGSAVTGVAVGDRVGVAWLGWTCGECRFCLTGRENLCERAEFTGWDRDGGYADRMIVDHRFVTPIPDGFDDLDAAPLLCGGVIGYRSLRVAGVEPGMRVGLFGFGASATIVIQVAVRWGCEVHVVTRSEAEQQRARDLGATWAGSYGEAPPVPLDAAITFAPVGDVVVEALRAVDRGGTVAINAIHLDRVPEFDYSMLWHERAIRSVANVTRTDIAALLALAAEIPIVTHTRRYPLERANDALEDLRAGRIAGAAVLDVSS
jgi:propanol-preferring alcohol dehydrogenase